MRKFNCSDVLIRKEKTKLWAHGLEILIEDKINLGDGQNCCIIYYFNLKVKAF